MQLDMTSKKEQRKSEIMQGALELFASKGFYNTSCGNLCNFWRIV